MPTTVIENDTVEAMDAADAAAAEFAMAQAVAAGKLQKARRMWVSASNSVKMAEQLSNNYSADPILGPQLVVALATMKLTEAAAWTTLRDVREVLNAPAPAVVVPAATAPTIPAPLAARYAAGVAAAAATMRPTRTGRAPTARTVAQRQAARNVPETDDQPGDN